MHRLSSTASGRSAQETGAARQSHGSGERRSWSKNSSFFCCIAAALRRIRLRLRNAERSPAGCGRCVWSRSTSTKVHLLQTKILKTTWK